MSAIVVGVLLSAQAAFATRPCVDASMSAAATAQHDEHDCCETMVSVTSLCAAKCTDSSKLPRSADTPTAKPAAEVAFDAEFAPVVVPKRRLWLASSGLDPPKTIRFCSFLI